MDRETIKKRIRALREMTTARGCSEAEAATAAAKLADLMQQYEVDESCVEVECDTVAITSGLKSARSSLWTAIAWATNTAPILTARDGAKSTIEFYGKAPGPEVAAYLAQICDRAVTRELNAFKRDRFYRRRQSNKTRRQAASDFTHGLVSRLIAKIYRLFKVVHDDLETQIAIQERDNIHSDRVNAAWAGVVAGIKVLIGSEE